MTIHSIEENIKILCNASLASSFVMQSNNNNNKNGENKKYISCSSALFFGLISIEQSNIMSNDTLNNVHIILIHIFLNSWPYFGFWWLEIVCILYYLHLLTSFFFFFFFFFCFYSIIVIFRCLRTNAQIMQEGNANLQSFRSNFLPSTQKQRKLKIGRKKKPKKISFIVKISQKNKLHCGIKIYAFITIEIWR